MSRWPIIKLGDVLKLDLVKETIDPFKSYEMAGVLSFGRGLFKREAIENGNTSYKYFLRLKPQHIVMSQLFGWEGALALSSPEFEGCFVSPQFPTFVCDESQIKSAFLGWLMKQPRFWDDLGSRTKGMGDRRRTLNPEAFFACQIPLPSLGEQRAIVARLDAVAEKARQVEAKLDEIEADAEALVMSLHHQLADGRHVRLGEVLELHEESERIEPDNEYPQVGVRGFGGGLFAKPAVRSTDTTYRTFNRLYPDAIVLSQVKGWEGALSRCPEFLSGFYASPEYRTFRCIPGKASPAYMGELIKTPWFWGLLQSATRGVGARRERTRPEQFLGLELPMPNFSDQVKAANILARLEQTKTKHAEIRQELKALLPSMLEQTFQGAE
jgi:type I restriction enzyme S subunit